MNICVEIVKVAKMLVECDVGLLYQYELPDFFVQKYSI